MDLFTPSVWDRLVSDDAEGVKRSVDLHGAALRRAVLRDLERLMNARLAASIDPRAYPLASQSVLAFGIRDVSSLSPSNPQDVQRICDSIVESVSRNDRRLRHVQVEALDAAGARGTAGQALSFVVRATLVLRDFSEPVSFQAAFDSRRRAFALSPSTTPVASGAGIGPHAREAA